MSFQAVCSTKSFNLVPQTPECKDGVIKSGLMGEKSKFRNCYAIHFGEKGSKVCVKIYSNGTIQINGVLNVNTAIEYIKKCFLFNQNLCSFKISCSFSNWTVTFDKKNLNLIETMKILNDNGILAYFQQGVSLIIKSSVFILSDEHIYDESVVGVNKISSSTKFQEVKVTLLLFQSGKCIFISSRTENLCNKLLQKIYNLLVVL